MIGELFAAACDDRSVLARIGGSFGDAARAHASELAALDEDRRRATRSAWAAAARAPLPPGLRGVDPSWIEAGLAELPPRAREAVATGALDEVSVWLARWACAELPPLPAIDAALARPPTPADVVRMRGPALHAWLEEVGLDQLAFALGPHASETAAVVGDRLVAAATRIGLPPRAGELGPRRAAIARARVELDALALIRIGARALAPHVDVLARRQLAVRLPRPLGRRVLVELEADAAMPRDQAATWRGLTAG